MLMEMKKVYAYINVAILWSVRGCQRDAAASTGITGSLPLLSVSNLFPLIWPTAKLAQHSIIRHATNN